MFAASVVISSGQILALAFPALAGLCLLIRGVFTLTGKRPESPSLSGIRNTVRGQAAIHGAATGPYSITAPITGKACYLYRTIVWQQKKSPPQGWEKLADETLHLPFFVEDSTGQLLIEPMGAGLEIPVSLREEYAVAAFYGASTIPPAISLFLARHRITPTNRILIEEFCIEPKSDLFVAGTVTENPGVEVRPLSRNQGNGFKPQGKREGQPEPEIVRLSGASTPPASGAITQQSRIAAALMKAGIQNPNAWEVAGVPYPGPASATAVLHDEPPPAVDHERAKPAEVPSGFDLKPPLVLMKGPVDAPFVLSARAIDLPMPAARRKPLLLVSIGATLTLASLWIFLANFLR